MARVDSAERLDDRALLRAVDTPLEELVIDLTDGNKQAGLFLRSVQSFSRPPDPVTRSKRLFDIVVAGLLLSIATPAVALIAAAVACTSRGPVIFRQPRVGHGGKIFLCLKFRTMISNAEQELSRLLREDPEFRQEMTTRLKVDSDPRITRVGCFLRKWSLDELPQLLNVLRGEMSIVGPRPYLPYEAGILGEVMPTILNTRPGITGLWQISGRNDLSLSDRIRLDARYASRHSVALDTAILFKSLKAVANHKGAS